MADPAAEVFGDKEVRKHSRADRKRGSAAKSLGQTRGAGPSRGVVVSAERKGAAYARFPRDGVKTGLPEPKKVLDALTRRSRKAKVK